MWSFVVNLLLIALFANTATAQLPFRSTLTTADSRHSVNICPVFELKAGEDDVIRIDFQNTSKNVIRYHEGEHGVAGLSVMLYRDDELVPYWITPSMILLNKNDIRELKPDEFVTIRINPNTLYKKLKPGRHELRFGYRVYKSKEGLDLTDFEYEERIIAYLEVFANMSESDDRKPR